MKWTLKEIEPGDIVRIPMSELYHYGVCTGEDRIVQFGEPVLGRPRPSEEIRVMAVDIKTFLGGAFAEVAELDKKERKRRRKTEDIIRYAEQSIGKGGYDILYNNCEHFANECVFGAAKSACVDDVRSEIEKKLPIINIYVGRVCDFSDFDGLPKYAKKKLCEITNERVLSEKRAGFGLLKYAVEKWEKRYDIKKCYVGESGKPMHKSFFFSISHSDGVCAVAVSPAPVGVDVETRSNAEKCERIKERFLCEGEKSDDLLATWTQKEAVFKCGNHGEAFSPCSIDTAKAKHKTYFFSLDDKECVLSVSAEVLVNVHCHNVAGGEVIR